MANFNSSSLYNTANLIYNSGSIYNNKKINENISFFEEDVSVPAAIKEIVDSILFDEFNVDYSETDFYINAKGKLFPLDLIVNYGETDLPLMPEAIENSTTLAGVDGDITLDTTYGPMLFEIIAVTLDNLTPAEKEAIKTNVKNKLNEIKKETKHLSFGSKEKMYDVKYVGVAEDVNYPGWLKFQIPFKSSSPYSKDMFKNRVYKVGEINTKTDVPTGFKIIVNNVSKSFYITINNQLMAFTYNAEIGTNVTVIIDTNNSTIKYINSNQEEFNAMKYYNKVFPKLSRGKNYINSISGISEGDFYMEWYNLYL